MNKQKRKAPWLAIGMAVYALLFLTATFFGLKWFWGFIADYELSRPKTAIDAYMAQLENQDIYQAVAPQIQALDSYLQTPQQCHAMIDAVTAQGITYARDTAASTPDKNVYVLLCGTQPIGSVSTVQGPESSYGFAPWVVEEAQFDFAYLTGSGASITVPHDYTVWINGVALSQDYITQDRIPYSILADFYADQPDLPYIVTYQTPAIWGSQTMTVTDPQGAPVTIDESTDLQTLLPSCDLETTQALEALTTDFITQYVRFISCSNETREANYNLLAKYIIPDSELLGRMEDAIWGLRWADAQNATVTDIQLHSCILLGQGQYLCDLTYNVFTKRYSNSTDTQTDLRLIVEEYEGGLRVLRMTSH